MHWLEEACGGKHEQEYSKTQKKPTESSETTGWDGSCRRNLSGVSVSVRKSVRVGVDEMAAFLEEARDQIALEERRSGALTIIGWGEGQSSGGSNALVLLQEGCWEGGQGLTSLGDGNC